MTSIAFVRKAVAKGADVNARGADGARFRRGEQARVHATQDQHHQHDAQEHLPVHRVADREGLQVVEDHGAHDGPGEVAEAAEHGHEDDLAREGPVEDVRRGEPELRDPVEHRALVGVVVVVVVGLQHSYPTISCHLPTLGLLRLSTKLPGTTLPEPSNLT